MQEGRGRRLALGAVPLIIAGTLAVPVPRGADAAVGAQGGKPATVTTFCAQENKGTYGITQLDYKCTSEVSVVAKPEADGYGIGIVAKNGHHTSYEADGFLTDPNITVPVPDYKGGEIIVIQRKEGFGTNDTVVFRRPKRN